MKKIIKAVCAVLGFVGFVGFAFAAAPSITIYPKSLEVSYGSTGSANSGAPGQYKLLY